MSFPLSVSRWLAAASCCALLAAQAWSPSDGLILHGDVVTMDLALGTIAGGRVVVHGEKIVAVLRPGEALPSTPDVSRARVVDTQAWLFPGLIDAHNHVSYGVLPLYPVPKRYENRYQWPDHTSYRRLVNTPKKLLTDGAYYDLEVEVVKYAEVKAIVGGVTSIQGTPDLLGTRGLVRNIENSNFGQDRIYQRGLAISDTRWQATLQDGLLRLMGEGLVDAWLVHLAEGVDAKSFQEFALLEQLGLLRDETVAIHATAATRTELRRFAQAGTKLVWSPLSNLLLYGKTTDVPTALQEGVLVCLGNDWSPSGSKNLLGELKVADGVDATLFGDVISDEQLVRMVTSNPAFALGLDDKIGQLRPGTYADLCVFRKVHANPYRSLIESTERDVALVLVGGEPVYGDRALLESLKPGDTEPLDAGGVPKAIDVTVAGLPGGTQTLAQIRATLGAAMQFDEEHMHHAFGNGRSEAEFEELLAEKFPDGIVPIALDPIFAFDDERFFDVLEASKNASLGFDLRSFWKLSTTVTGDTAVLAFVNAATTTVTLLDVDVALDGRAARNIVAHRDGPDGVAGTGDDDRFDSIDELDAVTYVGRSALEKLRAHAGQALSGDARLLAFLNDPATTRSVLDDVVRLDSRAAAAIFAHRAGADGALGTGDDDPIDSVAELDQIAFVGATAIAKLRAFVGA